MSEEQTNQQRADIDSIRDYKQYVVFTLAKQTYGIDISRVREIITMQELTSVPRTADYIKGIINLRGRVIPIFDLAARLGLISREETKATRIMVVDINGVLIGMIVDGVSEVMQLSSNIVEAPSGLLNVDVKESFIEGIAKSHDRFVIILNLESILIRNDVDLAVS